MDKMYLFTVVVFLFLHTFILNDNCAIATQVTTSCDFDSGLCNGWQQSSSDVFNWTWHTGRTLSDDTGPDYDHTNGSGYYTYIETSSPRRPGDKARLELSVSGNGELSCLEFYYHMYGYTMGTLTVLSGNVTVFKASGNHGQIWIRQKSSINLNKTVTFEGTVGSSYTGDLAIDDVSISNGHCQGNYMYIEASSPRKPGENAKLFVTVPDNGIPSCLSFYYHMYGASAGTLNVFSGNNKVFSVSGNQGKNWLIVEKVLYLEGVVTFEGIVGSSYTGDLAIDDVSITNGSCQVHTATRPFPTSFTLTPSSASGIPTFKSSTIKPSLSSSAPTFRPSSVKDSLSLAPSKSTPPTLSSSLPDPTPSTKTSKPTSSIPTVTPRTPSLKEKQEAVLLEFQNIDITKWNKQMEDDFKREVARVATNYCAADRTRCPFTPTSSRRKRSSNNVVFTSDMVHILPGYPKKSADDPTISLLAFYLQHPQGSSNNVVNKDALKAIVESDKSSIGSSIGGTISSVQSLSSASDEDEEDESDEEGISLRTGIIIAACVGGVLLLVVIIAVVLACKRRNRFNLQSAEKPTDNKYSNGAHFNDAYYISSGDQARNDSHYCSPDIKPEEHVYATLSEPHAYTNQSAVESEMNSEGVAGKFT